MTLSWNPRVWIRDWLMKPTAAERSSALAPGEVVGASLFLDARLSLSTDPETGEITGLRGETEPQFLADSFSIRLGPDDRPASPESGT